MYGTQDLFFSLYYRIFLLGSCFAVMIIAKDFCAAAFYLENWFRRGGIILGHCSPILCMWEQWTGRPLCRAKNANWVEGALTIFSRVLGKPLFSRNSGQSAKLELYRLAVLGHFLWSVPKLFFILNASIEIFSTCKQLTYIQQLFQSVPLLIKKLNLYIF